MSDTFTCNRCGHVIPNTGDRWEMGGLLVEHMETHTPHLVAGLTPTQPDRETLAEWLSIELGYGPLSKWRGSSHETHMLGHAGALLASALFNGGTKP